MVAQIDEQDAAMVPLTVDPSRQADGIAHMGIAKFGAFVRTIDVHCLLNSKKLWKARLSTVQRHFVKS
jgi:hypothetical protein